MTQSFSFDRPDLSFGQSAEVLSRSENFTPAMAADVLRSISGDIAVALEIDGKLWSQTVAIEIIRQFLDAQGKGMALQLWAGLLRLDRRELSGVPTILARPLILEVVLEACEVLDEEVPPQTVTLRSPDGSPAFADIMKETLT